MTKKLYKAPIRAPGARLKIDKYTTWALGTWKRSSKKIARSVPALLASFKVKLFIHS